MSTITTELAKVFRAIQRPGYYCTTGTVEVFAPRITVDGFGLISLPLLPAQAKQLIALAERAPYGRGEETLIDTEIRRTWQIGADQVHFEGKHWAPALEKIVKQISANLGITESIEAQFYKLLVYDQGSFFVNHRDTEKAPGMFATLVVVLPSVYSGGELVIRHCDRETCIDLCRSEPAEVAFAAFYADCVHKVLPITTGCRLTLIYNLLRKGPGRLLQPPNYAAEQAYLVELLQRWGAHERTTDDDRPQKIIYPLEHAYSRAELSFDALKGADAAVAAIAISAAQAANCELHLALALYEESGSAEHTGYSRRSGTDAFEISEVFETRQVISEWRLPDGSRPTLAELPFLEEELSPPDVFTDLDLETEFNEATGNEGASFERGYCQAALVFWPRTNHFAVINQAGLSSTLPYLEQLTTVWIADGAIPDTLPWRAAHELAGHMLSTWPDNRSYYTSQHSNATNVLALLVRLRDTVIIDRFLTEISVEKDYTLGNNANLLQAAGLLPSARAAKLIERIITNNARKALNACNDLLARCVATPIGISMADLIPAAIILLEVLPGDPARVPANQPRWEHPSVGYKLVADVLYALSAIDATLAEQSLNYFLAWPETYPLDSVLLPAAKHLAESPPNNLSTVKRLCAVCSAHLQTRIAKPLEPPQDWKRVSALSCKCSHCTELDRFLTNPEQESYQFKASEVIRNHLSNSIQRNKCDLDTTIDRRKRPYILVCTKNQASYQQQVQQRHRDQDDLAHLEKMT
ncbi:2OG-Fe(II) oxygenase [Gammaproteobacteria bacterium]